MKGVRIRLGSMGISPWRTILVLGFGHVIFCDKKWLYLNTLANEV